MKIALEASSLFFNQFTGIPFYIYNLYQALAQQSELPPTLAFRIKKKLGVKNSFQESLMDLPHVWHWKNRLLTPTKFDVVHSLHTPFLNVKKTLKVATVHDLAVHLPQFKEYAFASTYFQEKRFKLMQEFAKKADAIITVSQATKDDFLQFFDYPEERIHPIPLAPSFDFSTPTEATSSAVLGQWALESRGYFIAMGGVSLRKNTLNLVTAYAQSKAKSDYKLVITGKIEPQHEQPVLECINSNNLKDRVIITRYLQKEDLNALYQNAKAFLFPTFYEGFGIPILEAMANKLPVLTSTTGAAPETAGGHAVLVDPLAPESIAAGIDRLEQLDQEHVEKAYAFAKGFSWENTAKQTRSIYEKYM